MWGSNPGVFKTRYQATHSWTPAAKGAEVFAHKGCGKCQMSRTNLSGWLLQLMLTYPRIYDLYCTKSLTLVLTFSSYNWSIFDNMHGYWLLVQHLAAFKCNEPVLSMFKLLISYYRRTMTARNNVHCHRSVVSCRLVRNRSAPWAVSMCKNLVSCQIDTSCDRSTHGLQCVTRNMTGECWVRSNYCHVMTAN
jgi:hypothetical protein